MKYRNMCRRLILPLLLFTVVGLLLLGSGCAPVMPTRLSISPTSQTVAPGQIFTVDVFVNLNPAVHIAGAQFDLTFDSLLVTATDVDKGDLFDRDDFNTFFREGDKVEGTITGVVYVITTPRGTINAPGTLATITFVAGETEGTSPLDLSNVIVGRKDGERVTVQVYSGTVTVSAE